MVYRSNEPYNDLPLLPPPATIETARVLRRCITASRALAELKGAGNLIPNQSILINSIPLPGGPAELGNREYRNYAGCAVPSGC